MTNSNHTFIIPAYKDSLFIKDCIISLKQQTIPSKILIATSTPSKFLFNLAKQYSIEIAINENGNSIANDWNFAYKTCNTKYLTLAHQDDIYLPNYTECCLNCAEKSNNRNNLILFTDYKELEVHKLRKISIILYVKKLLLIIFLFKNNIKSPILKSSTLSLGNPICCPTVMFNIENIGPFEFSDEYQYNLDWDAWLRLAKMDGKFIFINQKLLIHRLHSESQTSIQINNNNRYNEEEKIFRIIWSKPISKFLMYIYRFGSRSNEHKF